MTFMKLFYAQYSAVDRQVRDTRVKLLQHTKSEHKTKGQNLGHHVPLFLSFPENIVYSGSNSGQHGSPHSIISSRVFKWHNPIHILISEFVGE